MKKITICAKKAIDYLKTFRLSNITVKFPIINLSFAPSIFSAAFGRKLLFLSFPCPKQSFHKVVLRGYLTIVR